MTSPLPHFPNATSSEVCPACGNFADVKGLDETTGWCSSCTNSSPNKAELALAANSVAVQHYVSQGQSTWKALRSAQADRPKCVVCGESIKRSKRTAIFCRRHPLCRRYSRRYVYLYTEHKPHMSKAEALAIVLTELTGE